MGLSKEGYAISQGEQTHGGNECLSDLLRNAVASQKPNQTACDYHGDVDESSCQPDLLRGLVGKLQDEQVTQTAQTIKILPRVGHLNLQLVIGSVHLTFSTPDNCPGEV